MNANELAQEFEEYLKEIEELPWGNHQILCDQAATMLRQQQDRIDVLGANYMLQLNINEKALQYINELEKSLDASLNLNKAQALRKAQEK